MSRFWFTMFAMGRRVSYASFTLMMQCGMQCLYPSWHLNCALSNTSVRGNAACGIELDEFQILRRNNGELFAPDANGPMSKLNAAAEVRPMQTKINTDDKCTILPVWLI